MTEAGRKLVAAARDGKLRDCKELMKLLPSLDFNEPPYCRTALWHAACRGHEAVARLLLDRGANVNHQDARGTTALHEAAVHGQKQIAELLIDRGASVDLPDFEGDTPLFLAVHARRPEMVALLLSRGAETNRINKAGLTCYHLAAVAATPAVASYLLYQGAYTNRFNLNEQRQMRQLLCVGEQTGQSNDARPQATDTAREANLPLHEASSSRLPNMTVPSSQTAVDNDEESLGGETNGTIEVSGAPSEEANLPASKLQSDSPPSEEFLETRDSLWT